MGMDYSSNQSNLHTPPCAFVTKFERQQSQKPSNAQIAKKSCSFCKSNSHPTSMRHNKRFTTMNRRSQDRKSLLQLPRSPQGGTVYIQISMQGL